MRIISCAETPEAEKACYLSANWRIDFFCRGVAGSCRQSIDPIFIIALSRVARINKLVQGTTTK